MDTFNRVFAVVVIFIAVSALGVLLPLLSDENDNTRRVLIFVGDVLILLGAVVQIFCGLWFISFAVKNWPT